MRWALIGLLLFGCGEDEGEPDLRGSVNGVYSLKFREVRARLGSSELAIQYVAGDGQVPVQVILRGVDGPGTYALPDAGEIIGSRDERELPPLTNGTVTLTAYTPMADAPVVGRFEAVLADRYSLVGSFDTGLELLR